MNVIFGLVGVAAGICAYLDGFPVVSIFLLIVGVGMVSVGLKED